MCVTDILLPYPRILFSHPISDYSLFKMSTNFNIPFPSPSPPLGVTIIALTHQHSSGQTVCMHSRHSLPLYIVCYCCCVLCTTSVCQGYVRDSGLCTTGLPWLCQGLCCQHHRCAKAISTDMLCMCVQYLLLQYVSTSNPYRKGGLLKVLLDN